MSTAVDRARETESSRRYQEELAFQKAEKEIIAERERAWKNTESGRRAQIEMLTKLMKGEKAPIRRIIPSRACKRTKSALRVYALWAKENLNLFDQKALRHIGDLVSEWRHLPQGQLTPAHKRLEELHQGISRRGSGNSRLWADYITKAGEVCAVTDTSGKSLQIKEDEIYTDPQKSAIEFDDIYNAVQKGHWNEDRESAAQATEAAKRKEFKARQERNLTERAKSRRESGLQRATQWSKMSVDADGFAVPASNTKGLRTDDIGDDGQPARLSGYSYSDDSKFVVLYVELSKPVRAQDLNIEIKIETLRILHRGSLLLSRSWMFPVNAFADETTWILEDGGSTLRLEVVKRLIERYDKQRVGTKWPCVFDKDPYRHNRTTHRDSDYKWTQTPTQVTVVCKVRKGGETSLSDVTVTIRRERLHVYVKRLGCLVEGNLNRPINVSESTWFLDTEAGHITVVLTKVEGARPWQRLLAGRGDDHDALAAYDDLLLSTPSDLDLPCYDDMTTHDKRLVLNARRLQEAKMKDEYALIEELNQEIEDALPEAIQADLDPSIRKDMENLVSSHDKAAAIQAEKNSRKFGGAI